VTVRLSLNFNHNPDLNHLSLYAGNQPLASCAATAAPPGARQAMLVASPEGPASHASPRCSDGLLTADPPLPKTKKILKRRYRVLLCFIVRFRPATAGLLFNLES
jgi:hypothetical protein